VLVRSISLVRRIRHQHLRPLSPPAGRLGSWLTEAGIPPENTRCSVVSEIDVQFCMVLHHTANNMMELSRKPQLFMIPHSSAESDDTTFGLCLGVRTCPPAGEGKGCAPPNRSPIVLPYGGRRSWLTVSGARPSWVFSWEGADRSPSANNTNPEVRRRHGRTGQYGVAGLERGAG